MRRIDIPHYVLKLGPDTWETAFPMQNGIAAEYLSRVRIEVFSLDCCRPCGQNPGCVVMPVVFEPTVIFRDNDDSYSCGRTGPVDCNGIGGSYVVPVIGHVWSRVPPVIKVVNDRPVYGDYYSANHPLLVYPAFRVDERGRLAVRWDQKLHELPAGRYEARIVVDGLVCGSFELNKDYCCPITPAKMTSIDIRDVREVGPKPEGITDMFDAIADWSSVTTCQLEAGDTIVSVEDAGNLCTSVLCRQPELVINDGITREIVTFLGCSEGKLMIERTGTTTIQQGAIIRFEWTVENVRNAMEGC
ncbi:MAG: hypothetical protein DI640_12890 [Sphingomonas taxi]|uniref:Uncharacterized protein n=1 Tax=Sphingomonas taxi TaxID=1549858 RepID=A0A2W5AME6_9SPHN|nr:MAG: hypothetical protein DI640_12890 [Sphingomonas taxi]